MQSKNTKQTSEATNTRAPRPYARFILFACSGLLVCYIAVMTYLYYKPFLGFTFLLPQNAPELLQPKDLSIQVHTDVMPINGLANLELLLIPATSANLYASLNGGNLTESKSRTDSPSCRPSTNCEIVTTPHNTRYALTILDATKYITFMRGGTTVAIALWSNDALALDKAHINDYVDSFVPAALHPSVKHVGLAP